VAGPLVSAMFQGGRFTAQDATITGNTLAIIVAGLPAYVLVKVITPGFYAREDTATPVKTAGIVLIANVVLNFALIPPFGIYGLATAIAACSWLNAVMLYVILRRRGHFRIETWLWLRILRQLAAGAVMAAALWGLRIVLSDWFAGSVGERLVAVAALIGAGGIVYFSVAWLIGAIDREAILILLRRKRAA
jgi:putative peptidoglycan lipid II flippase